jgi:hypothetical protein
MSDDGFPWGRSQVPSLIYYNLICPLIPVTFDQGKKVNSERPSPQFFPIQAQNQR